MIGDDIPELFLFIYVGGSISMQRCALQKSVGSTNRYSQKGIRFKFQPYKKTTKKQDKQIKAGLSN